VIRLSARRAGARLRIEITNDGPEAPDSRRSGEPGIGLVNARAQLDHLYGTNYSLELTPQPAGGMMVSLDLPWHTTSAPP
jgi:sensor histidine kinase YesM